MSEADDGTHPEIPDQKWTNPFAETTPLAERFEKIVKQNRDLIIVLDDHNARRGTGKTVASLQLAEGMDQTDDGVTNEKATLEPEELRNAYSEQPKRSGLVLDEGELGASNRQAMSSVNQALREIMSIGRVQEKYLVVNTPVKGFLDKDILKLADIWISMVRKGLGLVHFFDYNSYREKLFTPKEQWIGFKDIPTGTRLRSVYNQLTREKKSHISGDGGSTYLTESKHKDKLEKAKREAGLETRNAILRDIFSSSEFQELDISQSMIARLDSIDVAQPQISNIVNDE